MALLAAALGIASCCVVVECNSENLVEARKLVQQIRGELCPQPIVEQCANTFEAAKTATSNLSLKLVDLVLTGKRAESVPVPFSRLPWLMEKIADSLCFRHQLQVPQILLQMKSLPPGFPDKHINLPTLKMAWKSLQGYFGTESLPLVQFDTWAKICGIVISSFFSGSKLEEAEEYTQRLITYMQEDCHVDQLHVQQYCEEAAQKKESLKDTLRLIDGTGSWLWLDQLHPFDADPDTQAFTLPADVSNCCALELVNVLLVPDFFNNKLPALSTLQGHLKNIDTPDFSEHFYRNSFFFHQLLDLKFAKAVNLISYDKEKLAPFLHKIKDYLSKRFTKRIPAITGIQEIATQIPQPLRLLSKSDSIFLQYRGLTEDSKLQYYTAFLLGVQQLPVVAQNEFQICDRITPRVDPSVFFYQAVLPLDGPTTISTPPPLWYEVVQHDNQLNLLLATCENYKVLYVDKIVFQQITSEQVVAMLCSSSVRYHEYVSWKSRARQPEESSTASKLTVCCVNGSPVDVQQSAERKFVSGPAPDVFMPHFFGACLVRNAHLVDTHFIPFEDNIRDSIQRIHKFCFYSF